jgi:hypothetical protein
MNIISDEKSIRRNAKIGTYLLLATMALFGVSLYVAWRSQDFTMFSEETKFWIMTGSLLLALICSQVSNFFTNRFGRHPRPDEILAACLKGLTKDYTLYIYMSPVNYLLVGPAGVWIIEAFHQRGNIVYQKNRWQQKGGGFAVAFGKLFGQEGLGRPDLELKADLDTLTKEFKKSFGDDAPPINAALIFYDPRVVLDVEEAPNPTLKAKELKDFLRKYAKDHPLPAAEIKRITAALPEEGIE